MMVLALYEQMGVVVLRSRVGGGTGLVTTCEDATGLVADAAAAEAEVDVEVAEEQDASGVEPAV